MNNHEDRRVLRELLEACKALLPFAQGLAEQLGGTPGNRDAIAQARVAILEGEKILAHE